MEIIENIMNWVADNTWLVYVLIGLTLLLTIIKEWLEYNDRFKIRVSYISIDEWERKQNKEIDNTKEEQ